MANNVYLTIPQFFYYADARVVKELSSDENNKDGNFTRMQAILDAQAGFVETFLSGRVDLATVRAANNGWLQQLIADLGQEKHYARRGDVPKGVKASADQAREWLKDFAKGEVSLPDVPPKYFPTVVDSDRTDGTSQFDRIYGQRPSETGPSRGL